jgi:hypothetical protein
MAKAKPQAVTAVSVPVTAVSVPEIDRAEIETVLQKADACAITTAAHYEAAGVFLREVKAAGDRITTACAPMVDSAHKAHKAALAFRAEALAPLMDAERILKGKIAAYSQEPPKVEGVSLRKGWAFRIVDAAKIPRKYLVPDEKAIGGVVKALGQQARIPGVEVYRDTTVAASGK